MSPDGSTVFVDGGKHRIEEAMRRYREGEAGDPVFERLLGIEMKREQYV